MATKGDVHVGDVGTLYKGEVQNDGAAFPAMATATAAKIIFKNPDGVFERDAQVVLESGKYYLQYRVTSLDLTELHMTKGNCSWQGYIEFPAGERYHTNIETFTIEKNLN